MILGFSLSICSFLLLSNFIFASLKQFHSEDGTDLKNTDINYVIDQFKDIFVHIVKFNPFINIKQTIPILLTLSQPVQHNFSLLCKSRVFVRKSNLEVFIFVVYPPSKNVLDEVVSHFYFYEILFCHGPNYCTGKTGFAI